MQKPLQLHERIRVSSTTRTVKILMRSADFDDRQEFRSIRYELFGPAIFTKLKIRDFQVKGIMTALICNDNWCENLPDIGLDIR